MNENEVIVLRSVIIALVEVAKLAVHTPPTPAPTPEPASEIKSEPELAPESLMNVSSDPFKTPEPAPEPEPDVKSLLIDGREFDIPSDSLLFK